MFHFTHPLVRARTHLLWCCYLNNYYCYWKMWYILSAHVHLFFWFDLSLCSPWYLSAPLFHNHTTFLCPLPTHYFPLLSQYFPLLSHYFPLPTHYFPLLPYYLPLLFILTHYFSFPSSPPPPLFFLKMDPYRAPRG